MPNRKWLITLAIGVLISYMAVSGSALAANETNGSREIVQKTERHTDQAASYEFMKDCLKQIRQKTDFVPDIALVLGSGLGDFAKNIDVQGEIPYSAIKGFPVSTAPGHEGKFIYGTVGGKKVICMKGRVHMYEGYSPAEVVLPIRIMKLMGAKTLILTNAAGGLNAQYQVGDFMLLTDHISLFVKNPLMGENVKELGTRFPPMSDVYDPSLNGIIRNTAADLNMKLQEGVYTQLSGPSYESSAELRMLRNLGTDAVGMSTVIEAIAGKHAGMRVCAISNITNMSYDISKQVANEEEVIAAGKRSGRQFEQLLIESIKKI